MFQNKLIVKISGFIYHNSYAPGLQRVIIKPLEHEIFYVHSEVQPFSFRIFVRVSYAPSRVTQKSVNRSGRMQTSL